MIPLVQLILCLHDWRTGHIIWVFPKFKPSCQFRQIFLICLPNLANQANLPNSVKISWIYQNLKLKFCFILECLKSTLWTFWIKFEVFCVKSKYFSKIWQICLIWQIHFGKTRSKPWGIISVSYHRVCTASMDIIIPT